ncbi:putative uncharacterized oxidoreductase C513.07-like protein 2 [Colletotrichum chlorophyti]|uniref:Uncharacterized oxidoreductase C513.07-like protein 2 n=1 Tax=Colletotrichum chlorophyti TaxID=708187 RepID=A0A1Q8RPB8_9PEZI|nr:putative uncharacterized oxidoreductase C513.07-like protein 2 [Colletotrichum chlorophyti]
MSSSNLQTVIVTEANVGSQSAADKVRDTFPTEHGSKLTTVFVGDLTKPEHFRPVFDDTTVGVIHVASPVHAKAEDNVRDTLDPAVKGATGILEASKAYVGPSFRRVVHTSSFAVVIDPKKGSRTGYIYTESDWNPTTFEEAVAMREHVSLYTASKALSERAVWDWMAQRKPHFDLACLCPSMVLGPHLEQIETLDDVRSAAKLLWGLVDATETSKLEFAGCIDVRDTAAMLVAAF